MSELNQDVESEIRSIVREEITDHVNEAVDARLEDRDVVTTDQLDQLKEDVSERVRGLKERVGGVADRILGKDEAATLAQEHAAGTVVHLVGDDCNAEAHADARDELRAFIHDEVQSFDLKQDADENGADATQSVDESSPSEVWGSHSR